MTVLPLVGLDDLEGFLGESFTAAQSVRADAVLFAASSLVRSEAGRTWEGETVPDDVRMVALKVAARAWRNPDGVAQKSTGDASVSYGSAARESLTLTSSERQILARYRSTVRGLWSLGSTRADSGSPTGWVPVSDSTNLFPWY